MPKTIEELEAEMKTLEEKHKTELSAKDVTIEERNTTIAGKDQEIAALQGKLQKFEKAEFDEAIQDYTNSVWNKLKDELKKKNPHLKDPKDFKMEELHSVRNITETFKAARATDENHTSRPPRRSQPPAAGSEPVDNRTAAQRELDK